MMPIAEYVHQGFALVPIPIGRKGPITPGWQTRERCVFSDDQATQLDGQNLGLAHAYCTPLPTCALDIDDFDKAETWLAQRGIDLTMLLAADDAVQIRSGRPGRAKLLYRLPRAMATIQPEGSGLELRCASREGVTVQDVIPPSIHPDTGRPYEWLGDWRAIPEIPDAVFRLWEALIQTPKRPAATADAGAIREGGRNTMLTSLAGSMRNRGMTSEAIEAALLAENVARCNPPLPGAEVRTIARSVSRYEPAQPGAEPGMVELLSAADITPEPVRWLWNGYLARGKVHIIAGAPGAGKTTIALALAATITTGGRWPDGTIAKRGRVLIWSGEDDPKDTLIPRLIACGADLSNMHFVGDVLDGKGRRAFDPATDILVLREAIEKIGGIDLLIVDPIVSAVAGDTHKNGEVRRALQPLVDLALSTDCAIIGISHFSKGTASRDPVERVTGSIAFGALARIVLAAAKINEEDGTSWRLLARAKSNIGPDTGGFRYDIEQTELRQYPGIFASRVLWGPVLEGTARELLAKADTVADPEEQSALDDATHYVDGMLSAGPIEALKVITEGKRLGYSESSIQRASRRLGVKKDKAGMRGGWTWTLPAKASSTPEGVEEVHTNCLTPLTPSTSSATVSDDAEVF